MATWLDGMRAAAVSEAAERLHDRFSLRLQRWSFI
jgi:hypothetical protein